MIKLVDIKQNDERILSTIYGVTTPGVLKLSTSSRVYLDNGRVYKFIDKEDHHYRELYIYSNFELDKLNCAPKIHKLDKDNGLIVMDFVPDQTLPINDETMLFYNWWKNLRSKSIKSSLFTKSPGDQFNIMYMQLLAKNELTVLPESLFKKIRNELSKEVEQWFKDILLYNLPISLEHGDLKRNNFRITDNGALAIDWANAFYSNGLFDLSDLFFAFFSKDQVTLKELATYYKELSYSFFTKSMYICSIIRSVQILRYGVVNSDPVLIEGSITNLNHACEFLNI